MAYTFPTESGLPDPERQAGFYENIPTKRALAWVIDWVLTLIVTVVVSVLTVGVGFFFFFALWAIVDFLSRLASLTAGSATLGMRIMGIELRQQDGHKFDGATALLHTGGFYLSIMTGVQFISMILMVVTPRKQGLTDMLLGTAAVNRMARW